MSRAQYPSEAADKLLIRFPAGMREKIAEAAKAVGRSMNAEVVARLEKSFEADDEMTDMKQMVDWLQRTVGEMQIQIDRMDNDLSTVRDVAGIHDRNFRG